MHCFQFRSSLFAYMERTLSDALIQDAESHLASCPGCSRLLSEFKSMDAIFELEKAAEPNPFASTRILQYLENEFDVQKTAYLPAWLRILQPVTLAIAMLCGILIGTYTAKKGNSQSGHLANTSENIEFLRSNLFINDFADEDKMLGLNK
jgi:hypothetical protein